MLYTLTKIVGKDVKLNASWYKHFSIVILPFPQSASSTSFLFATEMAYSRILSLVSTSNSTLLVPLHFNLQLPSILSGSAVIYTKEAPGWIRLSPTTFADDVKPIRKGKGTQAALTMV